MSPGIKIEDDFDWCNWEAMRKDTLTYVRKNGKLMGEPSDLINKKLEAVRSHEPSEGRVAFYSYIKSGVKHMGGIVIKFRGRPAKIL